MVVVDSGSSVKNKEKDWEKGLIVRVNYGRDQIK